MNYSTPLINNYGLLPIPRGWSMEWSLGNRTQTFNGASPQETVNYIYEWCRNNGSVTTTQDIWLECNIEWLERSDPSRHKGGRDTLGKLYSLRDKKHVSGREVYKDNLRFPPTQWGHTAWDFLALLTARKTWNKEQFQTAAQTVLDLINQDVESVLGCSVCYEDAKVYFDEFPVSDLDSADKAAEWVRKFHNRVNIKLSRPIYTKRDFDIKHYRA